MSAVVVTVNGESITEAVLDKAVGRYIVQLEEDTEEDPNSKFDPNPENLKYVKTEVLNHLIEKTLLLQKARRDGVTVPHEAVARNIEMIRANFKDDQEWKNNLQVLRVQEEDLFEEIRRDMVLEKFLAEQYRESVTFSDEQLRAYYADNEKFMKEPDLFSFYEAYAQTADRVKIVIEEMKKAETLDALEREMKHVGIEFHNHVDVPAYQLPVPVVNVLSDLKPGEIASMQADETAGGVLVYKLIGRIVGKKLVFEDIREKLSEYLVRSAKSEVTDRIIKEEMDKAEIRYQDTAYLGKK